MSRAMVTEGLLGFFTILFHKRLNISARAREFEECLTRAPNGTRTLFGDVELIAITSISTSVFLNKRARESLETFRRVSRSGSLTIGSGSPQPAVNTRRRECKLPASAVSTPFLATCRNTPSSFSTSLTTPGESSAAARQPPDFPIPDAFGPGKLSHSGRLSPHPS